MNDDRDMTIEEYVTWLDIQVARSEENLRDRERREELCHRLSQS